MENNRDLFGQEIKQGDYVLGGQGHELAVYKVLRTTPKMVRVAKLAAKTVQAKKGALRYSKELYKIDNEMITFYLMKHQ